MHIYMLPISAISDAIKKQNTATSYGVYIVQSYTWYRSIKNNIKQKIKRYLYKDSCEIQSKNKTHLSQAKKKKFQTDCIWTRITSTQLWRLQIAFTSFYMVKLEKAENENLNSTLERSNQNFQNQMLWPGLFMQLIQIHTRG